jgi:hypothetical protein
LKTMVIWDDDSQQIVRWEFQGLFGFINFIEPSNETAGMALLSPSGKAHTLIYVRFWQFPLPDRPFYHLAQIITANQFYGFGDVVIAANNPFTRGLLRWKLNGTPFLLATSLARGRQQLQRNS